MKGLITIVLFAFLPLFSIGQSWTTSFCNVADDQGNLSGFYSTFFVPATGGYIYIVLQAKEGKTFNTHHIALDIYKNGNYSTTLKYDVQPDWSRFWAKVTFYDAAEYRIDTYDMDDYNLFTDSEGVLVAEGWVTIKIQ